MRDPLDRLVYGFVAHLKAPNRELIRAHAYDVALRLRLYADVLRALEGP